MGAIALNKEKKLNLIGYFLLFWWIVDFDLQARRYGLFELDFLWFCNIFLLISAICIILRKSSLMITFLGAALGLQTIWAADFVSYAIFNKPLNGFAAYVFGPGLNIFDFLSSTKHLFTIPIVFFAAILMGKEGKESYLYLTISTLIIILGSMLLGSESLNLNCALKDCTGVFRNFEGFSYVLLFIYYIILIGSLGIFAINYSIKWHKKSKVFRKIILGIVTAIFLFSSVVAVFGLVKFSQLPTFKCNSAPCNNCDVRIRCDYIENDIDGAFLAYSIQNKGRFPYFCNVFLGNGKTKEMILESFYFDNSKKEKFSIDLKKYNSDIDFSLSLDCKK